MTPLIDKKCDQKSEIKSQKPCLIIKPNNIDRVIIKQQQKRTQHLIGKFNKIKENNF